MELLLNLVRLISSMKLGAKTLQELNVIRYKVPIIYWLLALIQPTNFTRLSKNRLASRKLPLWATFLCTRTRWPDNLVSQSRLKYSQINTVQLKLNVCSSKFRKESSHTRTSKINLSSSDNKLKRTKEIRRKSVCLWWISTKIRFLIQSKFTPVKPVSKWSTTN